MGGQLNLQYFPFHGEHFHFFSYQNMAVPKKFISKVYFIATSERINCEFDQWRSENLKEIISLISQLGLGTWGEGGL